MFFTTVFNLFFYQPLLNILILFYLYLPVRDFGVAVVLLTLLIKLLLLPVSLKASRSQKAIGDVQIKVKEIQEKYKKDKEAQSRALLALYQKEKISPLAGCLPVLFQLPILIALYRVFLTGLKPEVLETSLYHFIAQPERVNLIFLGIIDLSQPNWFLAVLSGVLQFFQTKFSLPRVGAKKTAVSSASFFENQMLYFFPILTVFIVWKMGGIIGLYWITSTLFSLAEQYIIGKQKKAAEGEKG